MNLSIADYPEDLVSENTELDAENFFSEDYTPSYDYTLLDEETNEIVSGVTLDSNGGNIRIFNEDKSFDITLNNPKFCFNPDGPINVVGYKRCSDDEDSDDYYRSSDESLFIRPLPRD